MRISIDMMDDMVAMLVCDSMYELEQRSMMHKAEGDGKVMDIKTSTYRHGSFINRSKAPPANFLQSSVATDGHFLVCWISRPPRGRGRGWFGGHASGSEGGVLLLPVQLTMRGRGSPLQMRIKGGCQGVGHWKMMWVR